MLTVNDAEYVPAAKVDAKLTVTSLGCTPVVGETLSQDAVGVEIDHFNEPLPVLAMRQRKSLLLERIGSAASQMAASS